MSTHYIMRPVFNRPEMLQLSIDYEVQARKLFKLDYKLITVFIVEFGATPEVLNIVEKYPYPYECVYRTQRFGLSANILEGFKYVFDKTEDWVIYLEDDILIHETYFKYLDVVFGMLENTWSVVSPFNFNDSGDVNEIRLDRHYAAMAPVISKYFFDTFVRPCANNAFYTNPAGFVTSLNDMYKDYQHDRTYRYKNAAHHQQAGLINRLCDVARIEQGLSVVMPAVNRQMHIGFFGYNRPGGSLQGNTFKERYDYLKEVIKTPETMYQATGSKQYNDYAVFSDKLLDWSGTLKWASKNYIS